MSKEANDYDKLIQLILDRRDELNITSTGNVILKLDYQHSIHIRYGGSSDDHIYISEIDLREQCKSFWHPDEHSVSVIYSFENRISRPLFKELLDLIQDMDTKRKNNKDLKYELEKRSTLRRFIEEVGKQSD
jgi:hypothetical protein